MLRKVVPSPAMAVALLALAVALSGTAVAAGVVPVARRAYSADNAKKLQGLTASQLVAKSDPALRMTLATSDWSLIPGQAGVVDVFCVAPTRPISGGFTNVTPGNPTPLVYSIDSLPDGSTWKMILVNDSLYSVKGTAWTVCVS
ncbi:MAG TPA: hypothetical protein VEH52_02940 [Gaiellaceae bacterium]|jgi:hypothetical protein|nr:hypothetical protein [Gaiellaceae bacterium]